MQTSTENIIGYCKECGIAVTQDNLGERTPKVLCHNCVARRIEAQAATLRREEAEKEANKSQMNTRRLWSFIVGGIVAAIFFALCLTALLSEFSVPMLAFTIIGTYAVFAFVASLFYEDSVVRSVVEFMLGRTLRFPGLIFELDLDGIIWFITVKLIFAALGFLFGVVVALIGVVIGILIAPFTYPFTLLNDLATTARGESDV